MNRNHILKSLPLLANALGNSYGVRVVIGGNRACTDGSVIQLPSLPAEADQTFMGLVRGYVDHESAHIRHTDFKCTKNSSVLEKHVWNIFEDWRVENKLATLFPGCRGNFIWLIRHIFLKDENPTANKDPQGLLLDWLLLTVRSWDVPELENQCAILRTELDGLWPNLMLGLDATLEQVRSCCPDSKACLDYAHQVVDQIAREIEKSDSQSSNKSPDTSIIYDADHPLKKLLAAKADDLPQDMGGILERSLETRSGSEGNLIEVATVAGKKLGPLDPDQMLETRRITTGLRARLYGMLQATRTCRNQPSTRGQIAANRLHRLATNDPRVFMKIGRKPAINTALHILLDCSGSMIKRIRLAGQVCHVSASALSLMGVNVAVTAFPAGQDRNGSRKTVCPILKHGDRMHSRFRMSAAGRTPMVEALWWVLQQMVELREERKLILVVTDGQPDDSPLIAQVFNAAGNAGVELYGLGIEAPGICALLPGRSANINKMIELAPAMFQLFGRALAGKSK